MLFFVNIHVTKTVQYDDYESFIVLTKLTQLLVVYIVTYNMISSIIICSVHRNP